MAVVFETFLSKKEMLPCISYEDTILVCENIRFGKTIKLEWKHKENEQPSWVITGTANEIRILSKHLIIVE